MKLHLPKSLRAALLACLSVLSPAATTLATSTMAVGALSFALSSTAKAATVTLDGIEYTYDVEITSANSALYDGVDDGTIYLNMSSGMFTQPSGTTVEDIIVGAWTITDGYSYANFAFTGNIYGSGDITVSWANPTSYYFAGDLSGFSGDITGGALTTLQFGNYTDIQYRPGGAAPDYTYFADVTGVVGNDAVSGTGALSSSYILTYNYTDTATIANSSLTVTAGSFTLAGGATYTLATDMSVTGTLTVSDGSNLIFAGDTYGNHTSTIETLGLGTGSLTVNAGQALTISTALNCSTGASINNAGTLTLTGSFVLTDNSSFLTNTGTMILTEGTSFDISAVTDYGTDDSSNYTITVIDGGGTVTLEDGLDYTALFTTASLVGKNVISFENGVLTFTELASLVYSDGNSVNWYDGATMGGDTYTAGMGIVFDTASADVTLTGSVNPDSLTISGDITVSMSSSQYGFFLNCSAVIINSGSTLAIDSAIFGETLSFDGSSTTSTLQINVAEGATYNDTDVLTSYEGKLVVSGGLNLNSVWSADGFKYNFSSVELLAGSSLYIAALTMNTDTSFAASSEDSTLRLYSVYSNNTTTYDTIIGGYKGNLIIESGRYSLGSAVDLDVASLTLNATSNESFGKFQITSSTLGGEGDTREIYMNGLSDAVVVLYMYGGSIYANVTIDGTGCIDVASGYTAYAYGTISDAASTDVFSLAGSGTLILDGSVELQGTMTFSGSKLTAGDWSLSSNGLGASTLNFEEGGSFDSTDGLTNAIVDGLTVSLTADATVNGSLSLTSSTVSGSTLSLVEGSALTLDSSTVASTVSVTTDSSITLGSTGASTISSLTADVDTTLSFTGDGSVSITKLNDYAGTLAGTAGVTLNTVSVSSGVTTTVTGTITAGALAVTGEGNVSLATVVLDGGSLTMSLTGTGSITSLTVTGDSTVNYVGTSTNLFDIDAITIDDDVTLTVMLSQYSAEQLADDINLGLSGSISEGQIAVYGYDEDSYTLELIGDTWYLNVAGAMPDTSAMWDQNWGDEVLSGSPGNITTLTSDDDLFLGGSEYAYDVDGVNTVAIIFSDGGSASAPVVIVGGYSSDDDASVTLPDASDVWIMVTGGYVDTVIGGNVANNWATGSTIFNYTGDTHIMYTGGELGTIIGGTHRDGDTDGDSDTDTTVTFMGNSYISLYDVVTGAVIGANTSTHNGATNFIGDTNIYIYVPQSYTGDASTIDGLTGFKGIVGGSACLTNGYNTMDIEGNTNITVDLSEYEITGGDEDTFAYTMIGGSYCSLTSSASTISGDTNITVTSIDGVTFSNYIMGGSYLVYASASSVIDNTYVTIDATAGGTFTSVVLGGSYNISSGASCTTETTNVEITGADGVSFSGLIIGGNYIASTGSISTTTSSNITINTASGMTLSNAVYGGDYGNAVSSSMATGSTSVTITGEGATFSDQVVGFNYGYANCSGTASINISGDSTFTSRIIGGSYANALGAILMSGDVDIDISGGTYSADVIGGNYNASGYTSTSTNLNTVDDISIDISGGTFSSYLYGGSYIANGNVSTDACYTSIGDVDIIISGDASLYNISGGSYVGAATIVEQGNISITLESGSISGSVYAAGLADANQSATWTTESTSVTVGSAFTFGSASTVTGGYRLVNNSVTSDGRTITNGSTLNFSDADTTYSNLSTTTFTDFDTVDVASGAVVDLSATTTVESLDATLLTKTGEGSLTLASSSAGSISVEAGSLTLASGSSISGGITLSGGSLTVVSLASLTSDVTVNADSSFGNSDSAITLNSTLTFADLADDGSFNTLDLSGCGTISLGEEFEMDFTDVVFTAEGSYEVLTGLDSSFSASSITSDVLVGLDESDYSDYYLTWSMDEDTLVLTLTERGDAIYWDGVDGSTWVSGGTAWDDGNDTTKTFSNEMSVIFDAGATNKDVVVDAAGVSVINMTVDNSTYNFSGGDISVSGSLYLTNEASASFSNTVDLSSASVNIGTGSTLSLGVATTIETLTNSGSISAAGTTLTITEATSNGGDITAGSLVLASTGSYVFGNVQLTGDLNNSVYATVTLGDGTYIAGNYLGGPLVISADASVYIGTNTAGVGSLSVGEGAELSMGGDLYVGTTSFTNLGTITTTGDVKIECGTTEGGTISGGTYTLTGGDYTFTDLTATASGDVTGSVSVSGALTLTDGGSIDGSLSATSLTVGDSGLTAGSLASTSLSTLSNGTGTLSISGSSETSITVTTLNNSGTISMVGYSLDVTTVTAGGTLSVDSLSTSGAASFTSLTVTGDVSVGGALSLTDGGSIDGALSATSLSIGNSGLTAGSLASTSLSTLSNGTGTLTINGSNTSTISVATLNSSGTISMVGYSLDVTTVTAGGTLSVADLSLGGDASFTTLTASGSVTSAGSLSVSNGASMESLLGGGSITLTGGDLDVTGSADTALSSLSAAGDASFGGGLSLSTASSVTSDLTVTGTLSSAALTVGGNLSMGGSTLSLTGALSVTGGITVTSDTTSLDISVGNFITSKDSPIISAASLDSSITSLSFSFDNIDSLGSLSLHNGDSYTLVELGSSYNFEEGDLSISNGTDSGTTLTLTSGAEVSIAYVEGNIVLTYIIDGVTIDGVWNNSTQTAGALVTVEAGDTVDGDQESLTLYVQDDTNASLSVDENATNGASVTTGTILLEAGSLTADMTITATGETVVSDESSLIVTDNGELTTDSMNVTSNGATSVSNSGSLVVSNALNASDATIANTGSFSVGDDSTLGTFNNEGSGTATFGDKASITNLVNNSTESVTVGDGSSVSNLTGSGSLTLAEGASVSVDTISASSGIVLSNGSLLDLGDDETLNDVTVLTGSASITTGGDFTIASYNSSGSLTITGAGSITFTDAVTSGGSITGDTIIIEQNSSFDSVTAKESLTVYTASIDSLNTQYLDLASLTYVEASTGIVLLSNALIIDDTNQDYVLSLGASDTEIAYGSITLNLSGLYTLMQSGEGVANDFYLIENTGTGYAYTWDSFTLSDDTKDWISDLINNSGMNVFFAESADGDLILSIEVASGRVWDTTNDYAYTPGYEDDESLRLTVLDDDDNLLNYDILNTVDTVLVTTNTTINMSNLETSNGEHLTLNNLSGTMTLTLNDGVVTLNNSEDQVSVFNSTLTANDTQLTVSSDGGNSLLYIASMELNASSLMVEEDANISVGTLTADNDSVLSGNVSLTGTGSDIDASYENATITMNGGSATINADDATGLTLAGSAGTAILSNASGGYISKIATTGATVSLGVISSGDDAGALELGEASTMVGGSLSLSISAEDLSTSINEEGSLLITSGSAISLDGTDIVVGLSGSGTTLTLTSDKENIVLFQLTDIGTSSVTGDYEVIFTSDLYNKYFTNGSYDANTGMITADRNDSAYNSMAQTENGAAGLNLVSKALFTYNPEANDIDEDMDDVLADMDSYKAAGNYAAADALASAVAGSTTTSLGSAAVSDVERQLRSIRNRTKMMGVDPSVVNEDMPYFNGWIAAEGGSSTLDADGTHAGHKLNNFGGSIGAEVDLNDMVSLGASFSALYGDLTSDGADRAEGDFNTMYGSLFARVNNKRWTHSFVATFGAIDATLDRTVTGSSTNYKTKGETDGTAFGLMYEVGYTYALTEDASTCIQPLFNVSLVNSSIGGYTETGSDAALMVGDQDNNYVTFGLGGLLETVVGENVYNRASVLSARAMLKFDAGDRTSEADVTLVSGSVTETVKGAEVGAVGVELGLGLTIPVTEEVGAIFMDVSCEFRSGYTNVNGSVGYRFSF